MQSQGTTRKRDDGASPEDVERREAAELVLLWEQANRDFRANRENADSVVVDSNDQSVIDSMARAGRDALGQLLSTPSIASVTDSERAAAASASMGTLRPFALVASAEVQMDAAPALHDEIANRGDPRDDAQKRMDDEADWGAVEKGGFYEAEWHSEEDTSDDEVDMEVNGLDEASMARESSTEDAGEEDDDEAAVEVEDFDEARQPSTMDADEFERERQLLRFKKHAGPGNVVDLEQILLTKAMGSYNREENIEHAGSTDAAKEVWRKWIAQVATVRLTDARQYIRARNLQEDLTIGPKDFPRLFHDGFYRAGRVKNPNDPTQIVWCVEEKRPPPPVPSSSGHAGVAAVADEEMDVVAEQVADEQVAVEAEEMDVAAEQVADEQVADEAEEMDVAASGKKPPKPKGPIVREIFDLDADQTLLKGMLDGTVVFFPKRLPNQAVRRQFKAPEQVSRVSRIEFFGGQMRLRRDELGNVIEDGETGMAGMEPVPKWLQSGMKYVFGADGKRVFGAGGMPVLVPRAWESNHVTRSLRLQFLPIRLNESHWEWCYSKWMENDTMFEPAMMTPHLHYNQKETHVETDKDLNGTLKVPYQSQYLDSAVPLLTRGSMNFYGVDMKYAAGADGPPEKLAIDVTADITVGNITERCHRIYFHSTQPDGTAKLNFSNNLEYIIGMKDLHTKLKASAFTMHDDVKVYWYGTEPGGDHVLTWKTVFEVPRSPDAPVDFPTIYQNFVRCSAENANKLVGVAGYGESDPGLDGTEASGISAFIGRPWYKWAGNKRGPSVDDKVDEAEVSDKELDRYGQALDVRSYDYTYSNPKKNDPSVPHTEFYHLYGQRYREFMFKPMPVQALQTFPPNDDVYHAGVDLKGSLKNHQQIPSYLNLHIEKSHYGVDASRAVVPAVFDNAEKRDAWLKGQLKKKSRARAPAPPQIVRCQMNQRYPEVTMSLKGDMRHRHDNMRRFFRKKFELTKEVVQTKWLKDERNNAYTPFFEGKKKTPRALPNVTKPAGDPKSAEYKQQFKASAKKRQQEWQVMYDDSQETRMLAPTTLLDAVHRYVAENRRSMAWTSKNGVLLGTGHDKINKPGGVYFSCRVDVGRDPGEGGLDSYYPLSNKAGVYTIADVMLARGVHDYLCGSDRDDRAGPPDWWKQEQKQVMNPPEWWSSSTPEKQAVTAVSVNMALAETHTPTMAWPSTAGKFLDYMPNGTMKFDKASQWPGYVERELKIDRTPNDIIFHRFRKLKMANGITSMEGARNRYSMSSLLFDDFVPYERLHTRDPESALPHFADAKMERMCVYPNRLSNTSKDAVFRRWLKTREAPEVEGEDVHYRIKDVARLDKWVKRGGASRHSTASSTLVAPCYVLALDYDDFQQAVLRGETEWQKYFEDKKEYLRCADEYMVHTRMTSRGETMQYLVVDPGYVPPDADVPPREAGTWETYDGPPRLLGTEFGLCYRPASRTRESWRQDKYAFGARGRGGADAEDGDAKKALDERVKQFQKLYQQMVANRTKRAGLRFYETDLHRMQGELRLYSVRLTWDLARLESCRGEKGYGFHHLFQGDMNAVGIDPSFSGSLLGTSVSPHFQTQNWRFNIEIVIMLMDMVQTGVLVRDNLSAHQNIILELTESLGGKVSLKALPGEDLSKDFPHVNALVGPGVHAWPTMDDVDFKLAAGGRAIYKLLHALQHPPAGEDDPGETLPIFNNGKDNGKDNDFFKVVNALIHQDEQKSEEPDDYESSPMTEPNVVWRLSQPSSGLAEHKEKMGRALERLEAIYEDRGYSFQPPEKPGWEDFLHVFGASLDEVAEEHDLPTHHILQVEFAPILQLVLDVWADHLIQLRVETIAEEAIPQLESDPAFATLAASNQTADGKGTLWLTHWVLLGHTGILPQSPLLTPDKRGLIYPMALRPAALRAPRVPGSLRAESMDLKRATALFFFESGFQFQYQRELVLHEALEKERVLIEKKRTSVNPVDLSEEERILDASSNAFASIFSLMVAEDKPIDYLWRILQGRYKPTSSFAAMAAFQKIQKGIHVNMPSILKTGVDYAGLLSTENDKKAATLNERQAEIGWRENRLKGAAKLAKTLNMTRQATKATVMKLNAPGANHDGLSPDDIVQKTTALNAQVVQIEAMYERAKSFITWLGAQKDPRALRTLRMALGEEVKKRARRKRVKRDDAAKGGGDGGGGSGGGPGGGGEDGGGGSGGGPGGGEDGDDEQEELAHAEEDTAIAPERNQFGIVIQALNIDVAEYVSENGTELQMNFNDKALLEVLGAMRASQDNAMLPQNADRVVTLASAVTWGCEQLFEDNATVFRNHPDVFTDGDSSWVNAAILEGSHSGAPHEEAMTLLNLSSELTPKPEVTAKSEVAPKSELTAKSELAPESELTPEPEVRNDENKKKTHWDTLRLLEITNIRDIVIGDEFATLEKDAIDTWQAAREEQLRVAAAIDELGAGQKQLLALFSRMIIYRRPGLLTELNERLKGVSSDNLTNMTQEVRYEMLHGKFMIPTNSDDPPDDLPREILANSSTWAGYKSYIADQLRLEMHKGKEHWSFTEVPLTPTQWRASALCQKEYPEHFTTSTARVPVAIEQTKDTLGQRNDDFLDGIRVTDEHLRKTFHEMTAEQRRVYKQLPWHIPFALGFGMIV